MGEPRVCLCVCVCIRAFVHVGELGPGGRPREIGKSSIGWDQRRRQGSIVAPCPPSQVFDSRQHMSDPLSAYVACARLARLGAVRCLLRCGSGAFALISPKRFPRPPPPPSSHFQTPRRRSYASKGLNAVGRKVARWPSKWLTADQVRHPLREDSTGRLIIASRDGGRLINEQGVDLQVALHTTRAREEGIARRGATPAALGALPTHICRFPFDGCAGLQIGRRPAADLVVWCSCGGCVHRKSRQPVRGATSWG